MGYGSLVLYYTMQTLDELITDLKLNPKQAETVKKYFEQLTLELLESLKLDNLQNFEETISSIKSN
jgi:hypothetical protein